MIDLLTITNIPEQAAQFDQLAGMRIFVDLERNGKAARQAGRNTFISTHQLDDVGRVRAVVKNARLMVRVNPFDLKNAAISKAEIDAVIAQGADLLMLPMFANAAELTGFADAVGGRLPFVPLLETAGALHSLETWMDTPGIDEVFVGLNDLHLSLGCSFMFEPLLQGHVDTVAAAARQRGLRFGFGGIARMDEGLLPGRCILAEHLRLGSQAVILSRTFNRVSSISDTGRGEASFEDAVRELRSVEHELLRRHPKEVESDRLKVAGLIRQQAAIHQKAVA